MNIVKYFEEQVEKTPNNVAVIDNDKFITYEQLERDVNAFASYLIKIGIKSGDIVAFKLSRTYDCIWIILGIAKINAVYLAINDKIPIDRTNVMLKDSNCKCLITEHYPEELYHDLDVVILNELKCRLEWENSVTLKNIENKEQLLYIIYTSGTTGRPKAIKMAHSNVFEIVKHEMNRIENIQNCKIMQFADISFDVMYEEIFPALFLGQTIVLVRENLKRNIFLLFDYIKKYEINILYFPTAFFRLILSDAKYIREIPPSVKYIIVAGEQLILTDEFIKLYAEKNYILINQYGPSEAHVVTEYIVPPNVLEKYIPIGKAIAGNEIFLINENGQEAQEGEIWISGNSVAQGYLNRETETARKFYLNKKGSRGYKTGDWAKKLSDGNYIYIGRMDKQIKIRGFRVELGEIESVIKQRQEVTEAAVVYIEKEKQKELCAFLQLKSDIKLENIKKYIKNNLPDYMMPNKFIVLDEFPYSTGGKIRYDVLKELSLQEESVYIQEKYEEYTYLEKIWLELLGLEKINYEDNFFETGGDSLLCTELLSEIFFQYDIDIDIQDFIKNPTLHFLKRKINEGKN